MVYSKESSAPTSLKIRLRTALVLPFVLQIIAAVGLVGYLSFRNGQEAVNRLASQVRLEVASGTLRVMEDYFSLPHKITRSNINAVRLNQIKLQDKEALERHFVYQMQTFPLLGEMFVATPDGSIVYVGHKSDGSFIANTTTKFPKRELYELDNQGRRGKLVKVTNNYDIRTRPSYKLALQKRGQAWTEVYLFTTLQTLGMTAVEPYYDQQGKLVAIFTAQFPLEAMSDFLKTLKVSPTGQVFILERAGSLAATSTGESSLVEVNGEKKQIKAVDSKNLLTQRTAQYLQQQFGDLSQVKQLQELVFDIDGKRQDVLVQPYSDPKGLDFLVVVVVPEADFMEQINANTRTTIMLCLLALGLAIAVAILTSTWITRPLRRIAKASQDMADGNFNQNVASSQILELEKLASAFNTMAFQLKNSFDKLNEVIVQANQVGLKVTSSTKQITTAGKQLEATVTKQAVSTNEVKATATSIASTSGELAKTIEDLAQKAQATADQATNSQASLNEMASAMHQLATATTLISTRLGILNENANNINSVVSTIAKVADQINLISLNAAIEAEKAGEYGAGFAVVAKEVKRLADSTTVASQEIEEMVKEIQSSVAKGVREMDKFSQQVNHHVEQVGRISGQMTQVIFQVQSLTPQFEEVSHSMSGQFEGARQISTAISHLSEASQQTVESLQQTNQVLDQLNDTALVLQGIISRKMTQ
jgi:methyl-accepting chemotaxis protein